MNQEFQRKGSWIWTISALSGYTSFFYSDLSKEIDATIIEEARANKILPGAIGIDLGAGGGQTSIALIEAGASQVTAIDYTNKMIARIDGLRKKKNISPSRLNILQRDIYKVIDEVAQTGFNLAVFKRSLYASREESVRLLSQTFDAMRRPGMAMVIHPEASPKKYCSNDEGKFVWHQALKRFLPNPLARFFGEYTYYGRVELEELCKEATGAPITSRKLSSPAYNFLTIRKE